MSIILTVSSTRGRLSRPFAVALTQPLSIPRQSFPLVTDILGDGSQLVLRYDLDPTVLQRVQGVTTDTWKVKNTRGESFSGFSNRITPLKNSYDSESQSPETNLFRIIPIDEPLMLNCCSLEGDTSPLGLRQ